MKNSSMFNYLFLKMDPQTTKKYNYWQWRTLIILMFGYTLYYFVRKHFSMVMPAMEESLGITKVQLGIFLTIHGVVYGISRFVNGFVADRCNRRKLMTIGLILSAVTNFAICFSPAVDSFVDVLDAEGKATLTLVYIIGSLWVLNGYFQGMGVPPCMSLMAHWIRPEELATKQSIWNASHSIGAGVISVVCGFILDHYGFSAWQLCFAVPASIALVGAGVIFFTLKDTPSSVGLPEIDQMDDAAKKDGDKEGKEISGRAYRKILWKLVVKNPIIWILAVANFCIYVVRFTILDWGATFLTQYKGLEIDQAGTVVAMSEIVGGILGMLLAGWFTDKFMKNRAHRTCLICFIGTTITFFLFWKTPTDKNWLAMIFLCLSSFFVYGPQALLGIAASNQATKHACATANGILGVFGYASTTVSGVVFGLISHHYGWDMVFQVSVIIGIIGSIVIACMWKAPADGYAKANEIIQEEKQLNL